MYEFIIGWRVNTNQKKKNPELSELTNMFRTTQLINKYNTCWVVPSIKLIYISSSDDALSSTHHINNQPHRSLWQRNAPTDELLYHDVPICVYLERRKDIKCLTQVYVSYMLYHCSKYGPHRSQVWHYVGVGVN